ncbi:MAG: precorrin-6y C5,15-methyltransferase (decarboxylating) subunit CbiE [Nitrospirae bacterium]|nr:precorrin-6y C5,15-methyltransferase (decarboxylating) subunit CbiE [Nitrospirota bacterium]
MIKIYAIGIGYKPLDKKAQEIIFNSEIILASKRLFEVFKRYQEFKKIKDRVKVINNVDETLSFIKGLLTSRITPHALRPIVLLASGDPMFFGIGRRLVEEFGRDKVEILPDLSSIQLAFSRIKEVWSDAFLMSLHGGPDPKKRRKLKNGLEDIQMLLEKHNKIAILTDKVNNPSVIAKELTSSFIPHYSSLTMFVCERLDYPDEKIIKGTPEKIAKMRFREPNVVIIEGQGSSSKVQDYKIDFGMKEDEIVHSRGLITKDEIRAIAIHKLRLPQNGVLWDIGAGSGSISIEAARLFPSLRVFAIEKDGNQISNIKKNKIRFNTANVLIIKGEAPDALKRLPAPDRVFIGGSGGRLGRIISFIAKLPVGIIIINAVTIETLNEAVKGLESKGFKTRVSEVAVSRSRLIGGRMHMSALNPIFIITGEKRLK